MPDFYDGRFFRLKALEKQLIADVERVTRSKSTMSLGLDLRELLHESNGRIIWPGNDEYESLRMLSYRNFENVMPKFIAICDTVAVVQYFIRKFRAANVSFTPRSGGHSTAGYSSHDGYAMLDLRPLNSITIAQDKKTVTVGPGVQFEDLYETLSAYNLYFPAGICPTVRVGGFMQGGGFGFASRMNGMNCDNVVHLRVVLNDGRLVEASKDINSDLFWAMRGGTGNNFGIVVEVTYSVYEYEDWGGIALYWRLQTEEEAANGAQALELMEKEFMGDNDDKRFGYMSFIHYMYEGEGDNMILAPYLIMRALYKGQTPLGSEIFAELIELPGCVKEWEKDGSYSDLNRDLYVFDGDIQSQFYQTEPEDIPYQEKQSRYFNENMNAVEWRAVIDLIRAAADKSKYDFSFMPEFNVEPGGAAIDDTLRGGNAFIHREDNYNAFLNTYWESSSQAEKETAMRFLNDWLDISANHNNGEAYQNYPKSYLDNWWERFWGEYFVVMLAVKYKYDKEDIFTFEQGVFKAGNTLSQQDALAATEKLLPEIYTALNNPIE